MRTLADLLADSLWDLGIRKVFGLPGGENVHLIDALDRKGLVFHLVRNESSAAYAAAACYRLSGQPQACLTTLGPGITHGAAGLGHLWLDRAAVVFLTACTAENAGPYHTHQVLDLTALAGPMAKSSFMVQPETAPQIPDVLSLMEEGRPGPVHLQMSNEVAGTPYAGIGQRKAISSRFRVPAVQPRNDREFAHAGAVVGTMKRPVIVAGLGVRSVEAAHATVGLAEALDAPVVVTPKAKGAISDRHALAAGVIGLTRTDPAYAVLEAADGVVAVGFDVVELVKPWDWRGPLVWLAEWPNRDPRIPAAAELTGDLAELLVRMAERDRHRSGWYAGNADPQPTKSANPDYPPPRAGSMSPRQVLTVLRQTVPRDTLMTVDVGSHKIFFSLEWPTYVPNGFLLSNGLSCMGYGLASAIGAGTEDPRRLVLSVVGDGGLAMSAGELGLLREIGSNAKIVVLRDRALDLIRSAQSRIGKKPVGTEYQVSTDHVRLAEAYGIEGAHVATPEEFRTVLDRALAVDTPFLIEVELDPASYPTTPAMY